MAINKDILYDLTNTNQPLISDKLKAEEIVLNAILDNLNKDIDIARVRINVTNKLIKEY